MSYEIEERKAVFRVARPENDERFPSWSGDHIALFAHQTCSNNVFPRTPHWNLIAIDTLRDWNDTPMLPDCLWGLAGAADGGCIKPQNRNVTGTAYIKQWKDACRAPSDPLISWRVSIWVQDQNDTWPFPPLTLSQALDLPPSGYGKYATLYGAQYHAALHALFPDRPRDRCSNETTFVYNGTEKFWHALYLFRVRKELPVHFCISS